MDEDCFECADTVARRIANGVRVYDESETFHGKNNGQEAFHPSRLSSIETLPLQWMPRDSLVERESRPLTVGVWLDTPCTVGRRIDPCGVCPGVPAFSESQLSMSTVLSQRGLYKSTTVQLQPTPCSILK